MENYGQALKLQEQQANSAGLAINRYDIYLKGVEASSNKLKATWESLWSKTIDPKIIIFFNNLFTKILQTADAVGGLTPIVLALVSAFAVLKGQAIVGAFTTLGRNIADIILKFQTLGDTAAATGATITTVMGGIGIAIAAAIAIYNIWNLAVEDNTEKIARLKTEIEDLTSSLNTMNSQKKNLEDLSEEFNALQSDTNKTTKEQERWTEIQNQIKEILPEVNGYYDEQGNYIIDNTVAVNDLVEAKQKEIEAEKELLSLKAQQSIKAKIQEYSDLQKQIQKTVDYYGILKNASPEVISEGYGYSKDQYEEEVGKTDLAIKEQRVKIQQVLSEIKKDFYSLPKEQQQAFLESIDIADQYGKMVYDALTNVQLDWKNAVGQIKQYTVEMTNTYKGLYDSLKSASESNTGLYNIAGKQQQGKVNFDDITKLIETNQDYVNLLYVENNQVKVNTDKIKELTLAKAEQALRTAEAAGASQKELDILKEYVEQAKRAIPQSREFADNFQLMIQNVASSMGDNATPALQKFLGLLNENSKLFEEGKIKSSEYFDSLEQNLQNVNFDKMFGQNKDAAQIFFSGMTLNATQALAQISSAFDAGEISLSEYTDSLISLGNVFDIIGDSALKYIDNLGVSGEVAQQMKSDVTDALSGIAEGTQQLASMQEMNTLLEQEYFRVNEQGLEWASEANQKYLLQLAQAAAASGQTFTDMAGNALVGTQQIYGYISQNQANFSNFANQAAAKTGQSMTKMVQAVGGMLTTLGNAIKGFNAQIFFRPAVAKGFTEVPVKLFGQEMSFLQIPNMNLQITGESTSLSSIGAAISDFGSTLSGMSFDNLTNEIYQIPGGNNQITDTAKDATNAYKDLGDAIKKVDDAAKKGADEQKKALNELEKAIKRVIDAEKKRLKDQLDAFKKLIDARKEALDWQEKEQDYQDSIEEKTKNVADMEAELAELSLDNSEEAAAKRLKLEEELAKAKSELADTQREHSIDEQKKALDDEYNLYKDEMEKRIDELESMLDKIESITAESVNELVAKLEELGITVNVSTGEVEQHHTGLASGPVGGQSSPNGEIMAKLLKGEWVLGNNDINSLVNRTIPGLMNKPQAQNNMSCGGLSIENLIRIDGNADPSILPNLDAIANKVVDKLSDFMGIRGIVRNAKSYSV